MPRTEASEQKPKDVFFLPSARWRWARVVGWRPLFLWLLCGLASTLPSRATSGEMRRVRISDDKRAFILEETGSTFVPWGFNYDHDERGRLLEDYWDAEWHKVEEDFREMKELGANVVRIHLQLGKFMREPDKPNDAALDRLARLTRLAERLHLYLDLTGLGCYHKKDVPGWYDDLSEKRRWDVQARFWEAIAGRCAGSPAVFCYDLMNEPVVPGGPRKPREWLGPAFAGKHFVQFITLDPGDRARAAIARQWVQHLTAAIRKHDRDHLITVGLVPWSLDRPGLTSGFVPERIVGELDFLSVHLYPEKSALDKAMKTLKGFSLGKPVVIEEMFPLKCPLPEFEQFVDESQAIAAGWIGFYWGRTPEECRRSTELRDALMLGWLQFFKKKADTIKRQRLRDSSSTRSRSRRGMLLPIADSGTLRLRRPGLVGWQSVSGKSGGNNAGFHSKREVS